ncbi:MAG: DNA topoisomerase III, partial [Planococcus sp. (in: firmicutes)]|nr:DNA topoisomerase III [Planococcus sp. (in: firmicutes)]
TLAMIAQREQDIRNFQPKPYYGLQAISDKASFTWTDGKSTQSFDKERIDRLFAKLDTANKGKVTDVKVTPKKQPAPPLFDLTELQKEAYKRYSWSAKETLNTLQNLYERYKIVTYPRTDSKHLTSDMKGTLKEHIKAVQVGEYRSLANTALKSAGVPQKGVIDDAKVSDHHAIIPTEETPMLHELSDKEYKLYDMIVRRFLAVFMPQHEYDRTTVTLDVAGETFQAKGNTIRNDGWKRVYNDADEEGESTLPPFEQGQAVELKGITLTEGKTKPPAFFNEGTLLGAMENPAQFMAGESKALIQTLGETGGLGTVATRADIIDKLFNSFLIEKKGKDLTITSKGRQLLELVPEDLKSPKLTADWETQLTKIAKGQLKKEQFMKEMVAFSKKSVAEIKSSDKKFKHDNITGKMCPDCGKPLLEVNGKRGKMHVCQDRDCGFKKNVSMQTNARCPNCHKRMDMVGDGDNKMFVCKCGHREKLSAFEKRKKAGQSKANKKDVNKYLKKQDEPPQNTAMADALKKMLEQND